MKVKELYIQEYNQFKEFRLDLTYPEGHEKAGQALDKVCFIGQSGTGKTSLIEILNQVIYVIGNLSGQLQGTDSFSFSLDEKDSSVLNRLDSLFTNSIKISFDNDLTASFIKNTKNIENGTFTVEYVNRLRSDIYDFLENYFKLLLFPSEMEIPKIGKPQNNISQNLLYLNKNFYDFSKYDFQSTWSSINEAISKDRELEIKKSLELSKKIQEYKYSQEKTLQAVDKFLHWRQENPNPIIDLADNFLDKILNRFNLKVKTEIDFEKIDDIKTIKIQTAQGKDILFERLSTGTKQVILTALPLYGLKPEKSIILFDEPERSLYPDIQAEIVNFYTSMAKDSQFFFATHSPLVASSFEPWEIVELKFNDEGYVYQELYYVKEKGRHVDNYTINPQYLTWTGILQKVFDLNEEGNEEVRGPKLIKLATLENQLKHNQLSTEQKKEKLEEYLKLSELLDYWNLDSTNNEKN